MKRKHKHEEHENHERWLVSYADFITLLFAFFTVMYALSQSDKAKYKQAAEAIQRAFLSGGGVFPLRGSPFTPFEKAPDKGSMVPPSAQDVGQHSKSEGEAAERIKEQIEGVFKQTTGLGLKAGEIDVYRTETGFKIRLNESVLYRAGSDKIKRDNIPFLFEMGKRLARLGSKVEVEGHVDNQEAHGGVSNWQMSLNRATNVVQFLVQATEFPKDKISISGFGDTRPLTSNLTSEGRAKNRRIEISVLTGNQSLMNVEW